MSSQRPWPPDGGSVSRQWSATYAPDVGNTGRARADLCHALAASGVPSETIGDALLVAGELTGNAVRHAGTDFTILAVWNNRTLRLEVSDRDSRPPSLLGLDEDSTSGRGLHLVAAVAADWGWHTAVDAGVSGKVVWAELRIDGRDNP